VAKSPRAAAQLGFVEQALGLWPQAEGHVSEALRAADDPWIKKNRAVVEEALRTIRMHVGRVEIGGGRPGANVTVNGQPVGLMPLAEAIAVNAGPVDVEVKAPGYLPAVKTVNVAAGEYSRVSFALVAQATPPPAPKPAVPTAVPVAPVIATERGARPADADTGRTQRIAAIAVGAGGLAAIGVGIVCSVVGKNKFDAINEDAAADRPFDEGNSNWKSYETAAAVLYVAGAGALAAGTALYLTGRPARAESHGPSSNGGGGGSISVRPLLSPSRGGAVVSVRF
jgi:hypothetical protein